MNDIKRGEMIYISRGGGILQRERTALRPSGGSCEQ